MKQRKFEFRRQQTVLEIYRTGERWKFIRELSGVIFFLLAIVAMFNENVAFGLIKKLYVFMNSFLGQFWLNLIGITLIGLIGGLLFWLRTWKRTWYGLIEISFALAYGWYAINKVTKVGYVEVISVIASVYLVVRGIDNYLTGIEEENEQRSPPFQSRR